MTGWRLITELHPNRDPDNLVLLAHFNEPPHEGPPDYVTLASWGTVMPGYTDGYIECASYSGRDRGGEHERDAACRLVRRFP